jgi:hypothetical protein
MKAAVCSAPIFLIEKLLKAKVRTGTPHLVVDEFHPAGFRRTGAGIQN